MNILNDIKGYTVVFLKKMVRVTLYLTDFVPTQKNKILFFGGMRGYTCNPKYICEYLNEKYPGKYKLCWIAKDNEELEGHSYLQMVKYSPFSLLYALITSRVYVTNGVNAICPKSKKRLIIGTMHGTPYKMFGYLVNEKFTHIDATNSAFDILISNSDWYTDNMVHRCCRYEGEVLTCGYPRNDIFFDVIKREAASKRVREYYGLHGKVVLFAPTYRGAYKTAEKIDIKLDFIRLKAVLQSRFGNDVTIAIRMHYFDKNKYRLPDNVIDVGDWHDMQEILCATDILITDYSSTIWDFALTLRPCLLFVPDLDHYKTTRGLLTDPSTWSGIICKNMDELCVAIKNLDEPNYAKSIKKYLLNKGSYEHGKASELVSNEILKFMRAF